MENPVLKNRFVQSLVLVAALMAFGPSPDCIPSWIGDRYGMAANAREEGDSLDEITLDVSRLVQFLKVD